MIIKSAKTLVRKVNITKAHFEKLVYAVLLFSCSLFILSTFYIKTRIEEKYKKLTEISKDENTKMKIEILMYNEAENNEQKIINGISKIAKSDLFVKGFTTKTRDEIFDIFERSEAIGVERSFSQMNCSEINQKLLATKTGKCFKITGKITRFNDDKIALRFDRYIKLALPGFVFNSSFEIKKTKLQDMTVNYDLNFEYNWVYFESLV